MREARLRDEAHRILEAALKAAEPARLVRAALEAVGDRRTGESRGAPGRLLLVAFGKAALPMTRGALEVLGGRVAEGVVVAPAEAGGPDASPMTGRHVVLPPSIRLHRGRHPLPDARGVEGARAVRRLVAEAGPQDRVLLLVSGGGSALLTLPAPGVELQDLRAVTEALLRAGADIREVNTVRKHLEVLKGGGLAREAWPARVDALVLSDVPGDPPDVIASGPASPDPTTFGDALAVLERHGLLDRDRPVVSGGRLPAPAGGRATTRPGFDRIRAHLERGREGRVPETPAAGAPIFERVTYAVVGNAATAARAAAEAAEDLGYAATLGSTVVTGEARSVGRALARRIAGTAEPVAIPGPAAPVALVQAGETTVRVEGDGVGGRNQEVALAAALELQGREGVLVLSAGTDGIDGPTSAAGAIATGSTVSRAARQGLDALDHLRRNDSHAFFQALDDLVITGPTGTNVTDLMVALSR